jgi:PIN domain nuclease of toxin-antitoxin system
LNDSNAPEAFIRNAIDALKLTIIPFDIELAYQAGLLRSLTKQAGLSLGDRACLALAWRLKLPVLTTDKVWGKLSLGITIQVIR